MKLELVAVYASSAMLDLIPPLLYAVRVRGDCRERLPFDDATFDGAFACGLFEHIAASGPVFRELARLLKPETRLVFTFPPRGVAAQAPLIGLRRVRRFGSARSRHRGAEPSEATINPCPQAG